MTCKAKAIAGGFETLYKRWRPDERAKGRRESQENKLNEGQGANKTGGKRKMFSTCVHKKTPRWRMKRGEKLDK